MSKYGDFDLDLAIGKFINAVLCCIFYCLHKNSNGLIATYCMIFNGLNFIYFIQKLIPIIDKYLTNYDGKDLYLILKNKKLNGYESLKK